MPDTKNASEFTGGCQCGAVRYSIRSDAYRLNVCHCLDCQKQSGSAFGMSLVINPDSFRIETGALKSFRTISSSGREKTCAFCPVCGVRIYNRTTLLMSVKAGTLDEPSALAPDAHYWTQRRQSWVQLPDDVPCFDEVE